MQPADTHGLTELRRLDRMQEVSFRTAKCHACHDKLGSSKHPLWLLQVQTVVLYQRIQLGVSDMQLHIAAGQTPLQRDHAAGHSHVGSPVLSPCQCTAFVDMHRISGDAYLPGSKALVNLDELHVQLNPEAVSILGKVFDQQGEPVANQEESASQHTVEVSGARALLYLKV